MKQPATGEKKTVDKALPKQIIGEATGNVTGVSPASKTFTAMIQGRAITFSAARLSKLPTVGENIDITFTVQPDQLPIAKSTAKSGSETGSTLKPGYEHCSAPHKLCGPLQSLNLKDCPC
jgi:hypothetical protein